MDPSGGLSLSQGIGPDFAALRPSPPGSPLAPLGPPPPGGLGCSSLGTPVAASLVPVGSVIQPLGAAPCPAGPAGPSPPSGPPPGQEGVPRGPPPAPPLSPPVPPAPPLGAPTVTQPNPPTTAKTATTSLFGRMTQSIRSYAAPTKVALVPAPAAQATSAASPPLPAAFEGAPVPPPQPPQLPPQAPPAPAGVPLRASPSIPSPPGVEPVPSPPAPCPVAQPAASLSGPPSAALATQAGPVVVAPAPPDPLGACLPGPPPAALATRAAPVVDAPAPPGPASAAPATQASPAVVAPASTGAPLAAPNISQVPAALTAPALQLAPAAPPAPLAAAPPVPPASSIADDATAAPLAASPPLPAAAAAHTTMAPAAPSAPFVAPRGPPPTATSAASGPYSSLVETQRIADLLQSEPIYRAPAAANSSVMTRAEADTQLAITRWLEHWNDCRPIMDAPLTKPVADAVSHAHPNRLFVLRASDVRDVEVPIVFASRAAADRQRLQELGKLAETEAPQALALHLMVSLVHDPPGGPVQMFGHAFVSGKLTIQPVSCKIDVNTLKGKIKVNARADPPQTFMFYTGAMGRDWQLLLDVLVEELPVAPAFAPGSAANVSMTRGWHVDQRVTRSKASQKKPSPKKRTSAPSYPPPPQGGRATPIHSATSRAVSYNRPSALGAKDARQQQIPYQSLHLGWTLVRFDNATESRINLSKLQLQPESLRSFLLKPFMDEGRHPSDIPEENRLQNLHSFIQTLKLLPISASVDCDIVACPLPELARRLFPPEMPIPLDGNRLGGVHAKMTPTNQVALSANTGFDCFIQSVILTIPDMNWVNHFLRSLDSPVKAQQKKASGIQLSAPATTPLWQLQGFRVLATTHNALRFLDGSLKDYAAAGGPALCSLDEARRSWRIDLTPQGDGVHFSSNSQLPVEFVCDDDCAFLLELVALVGIAGTGIPAAQGLGNPIGGLGHAMMTRSTMLVQQSITLGWIVMLPRWHTNPEALWRCCEVVGGARQIDYHLQVLHDPPPFGLLSTNTVWKQAAWGTVDAKLNRPLFLSFGLRCDRLVEWLQQFEVFTKTTLGPRQTQAPLLPEKITKAFVRVRAVHELPSAKHQKLHVRGILGDLERTSIAANVSGKLPIWDEGNELDYDLAAAKDPFEEDLKLEVFNAGGEMIGALALKLKSLRDRQWQTCKECVINAQGAVVCNLEFDVYLSAGEAPPPILHSTRKLSMDKVTPREASRGASDVSSIENTRSKDTDVAGKKSSPPTPHLAPAAAPAPVPQMHVVHQPVPPTVVPGPRLPPELQTVVERVFLRDQGTQSDPPELPGMDENIIRDGTAATAWLARKAQVYQGPGMQPLGQTDRARLLQELGDTNAGRLLRGLPAAGPLSGGAGRRELRWKFEEDDPLQADEILVEFVAHRSIFGCSGERVFFRLRLFLFPPARTAAATLVGAPGEACLLRSAVTGERLAVTYMLDGAARRAFTSSASGMTAAAEVHRKLAEYLSARHAEVEVWSADANMQIGTVAVPLEPLVRQGRPVSKLEVELPVLDPMTGEPRGFLRALFSCRGRQPQILNDSFEPLHPLLLGKEKVETPQPVSQQEGVGRHRFRHKAKSLGIKPTGDSIAFAGESLEEAAKRQRLEQLLISRRAVDDFSDHIALLSAAEEVRHDQKKEEVARRLDRFNTVCISLLAPFGTPATFHAEFSNPYSKPALFTVTIAEKGQQPSPASQPKLAPPLHGILSAAPEAPLALVADPDEWRRLVMNRRVPPPAGGNYGVLGGEGMFSMNALETLPLPFRYLAFDHPCLAGDPNPSRPVGLNLAELSNLASECAPDREFVVLVALHQGPIIKRLEVIARPQPCVVDRTIRFFEAEGTPLEKPVALPLRSGILSREGPALDQQYVFCTDKDVHLQRTEEDSLLLRFVSPQAPKVRSFFVISYSDPFFLQVTSVQLLEVMGMKCEHLRVCAGQSVDRTISVPPVEVLDAQALCVYSSDPDTVIVQQATEINPHFGAQFVVTVMATQVGPRACRVHAVDASSKRTIAAFLLVIVADIPDVKMVHEITLPVLTTIVKRLSYKNEAMKSMRYAIKSSNPAVVTVRTPELVMPARDSRYIELLFHACPATLSYSTEVFIFVTSEDRAIQETRLLQLSYT